MTFVERVQALGFSANEYVVIGSGLLGALGLRTPQDIDLVVSAGLFKALRSSGMYRLSQRHGEEVLETDDVEIWQTWGAGDESMSFAALYRGGVTVDGVRFCHPQTIIAKKQARHSEKDVKDIELLKAYLRDRPL